MDKYRYTYPIEMQSTLSDSLKGKEMKWNKQAKVLLANRNTFPLLFRFSNECLAGWLAGWLACLLALAAHTGFLEPARQPRILLGSKPGSQPGSQR